MRTLDGATLAALAEQGTYPGYLVQITLVSQTLYLCSFDQTFTFNSVPWNTADISISGLGWDGSVTRQATLTLGDPDLIYWAFALNLQLSDCPIQIWLALFDVPNEATPIYSGRCGQITRDANLCTIIQLANDSDLVASPRMLVQDVIASAFLVPAGTIISIGGQRWQLARTQQ